MLVLLVLVVLVVVLVVLVVLVLVVLVVLVVGRAEVVGVVEVGVCTTLGHPQVPYCAWQSKRGWQWSTESPQKP